MNKFKLTCIALGLGFSSISANAVLITDWDYLNDAGFGTDYTSEAGDATGVTATGATLDQFDPLFSGELPKTLSWGQPYKAVNPNELQSSLAIDDSKTGSVTTSVVDGVGALAFSEGTGLTHENWGVTGDTLVSATLFDGLFLAPTAPVSLPPTAAPALQFQIQFEETYNHPTGGTCEYGGTLDGEVGINQSGCADLFTIILDDDVSFTQDGDAIFLSNSFVIPADGLDDYEYTLTTRLLGLTFVENVDCPEGKTCIGFLTEEDNTNTLEAAFAISAREVTEPGTLAIFGLGLLGLAGLRRRA
ncbi:MULTISPECIES: THxN family PEP-CTERM protein [unclassified Agarivorans]|uniref:THxN family PEP-CTERM protein n=1 Tax=unclassified Agarivorans TaxID=2636026 RepID=UPI003D7DB10F